jgi:hypothetical protein
MIKIRSLVKVVKEKKALDFKFNNDKKQTRNNRRKMNVINEYFIPPVEKAK